jgi:hypothetical protein
MAMRFETNRNQLSRCASHLDLRRHPWRLELLGDG